MTPRTTSGDAPTHEGFVETVATRAGLVDELPVPEAVATDLWDVLEPGRTVVLQVPRNWQRKLCGVVTQPYSRNRYFVVARIEQETGRGGALLLRNGGALRDVVDLVSKHQRALNRLEDASFRGNTAAIEELERVVDTLSERKRTRDVSESGFDEEWLPRGAVKTAVGREPESIDAPSVAAESRQTRLPGGGSS